MHLTAELRLNDSNSFNIYNAVYTALKWYCDIDNYSNGREKGRKGKGPTPWYVK